MDNNVDKDKLKKYNNVNARTALEQSTGEEVHFIQNYETVQIYKYSSELIRLGVPFISHLGKLYKFSIGQKLLDLMYNNIFYIIQAYTSENLFIKKKYIYNSINTCNFVISLIRALELSNAIQEKDAAFQLYEKITLIKMQGLQWVKSIDNKLMENVNAASAMYYNYKYPLWPFSDVSAPTYN